MFGLAIWQPHNIATENHNFVGRSAKKNHRTEGHDFQFAYVIKLPEGKHHTLW